MIRGSCLCGKIRYEIQGGVGAVSHCHCSRCRKAHGAAFGSYARVNRKEFTLLTGAELFITGNAHLIVLMHVVTWYVFAGSQYRQRSEVGASVTAGSWRWMRSTSRGFSALHIGVAAVIIAAAAVWAYQFRTDASHRILHLFLARGSFAYWTIVHVTLSWLPK